MVGEHLDDVGRPGEDRARADEDPHRSGGDEAVDEVLREAPVDLRRMPGRTLPRVAAREVDVGVETVPWETWPGRPKRGPKSSPRGRLRSPMPIRGASR